MNRETELRLRAHELLDHFDIEKVHALLALLEEDNISPEEAVEIRGLRSSEDWVNWREVANRTKKG